MSWNRIRASLQILGVLCVVVLAPSASGACRCVPYEDWGFVTGGDSIPSNSPGLLWWGDFQGEESADEVVPVQISTASGEPLTVEYELVSKDGLRSLWLFHPKGGLEAGKSYIFSTARSTRGSFRAPEPQRIRVVVDEAAAESPPNPVGLSIGAATAGDLEIAAGVSCSEQVNAAQLPIRMELPESLEKFRDHLYFETIIDGRDEWAVSDSICTPVVPGVSWRGKGIDLLYRACGEARGDSTGGLAAGSHTVEMRASLPGTQLRIVTVAAEVEPHCPESP